MSLLKWRAPERAIGAKETDIGAATGAANGVVADGVVAEAAPPRPPARAIITGKGPGAGGRAATDVLPRITTVEPVVRVGAADKPEGPRRPDGATAPSRHARSRAVQVRLLRMATAAAGGSEAAGSVATARACWAGGAVGLGPPGHSEEPHVGARSAVRPRAPLPSSLTLVAVPAALSTTVPRSVR